MPRILAYLIPLTLALGAGVAHAQARAVEDLEPSGSFVLRWGPARCWEERPDALRSVRCVTQGRAEPVFVASHEPYAPPIDLRRHLLEVWLRIDDVKQLGALELRVSSDNFESSYFAFQVPLYGDPEFNYLQDRMWARYTFSFGSARVYGQPDPARINATGWLVQDKGTGGVDVTWSPVSAWRTLERGAVSITFDDGDADQFEAVKAMARHDFKGTAYIIPSLVGAPAYLSLEQLELMRDRYHWEIAGHHEIPLTQLREDHLDRALLGVQRFLNAHGFRGGAAHFAYPLGKIDAGPALAMARKYFQTARLAGSGPETLPPADPHRLRVRNVSNVTSPEEIATAARSAYAHGDWLILMFHHLRAPADTALDYDPAQFDRLLDLLARDRIRPETVGEVWERLRRR